MKTKEHQSAVFVVILLGKAAIAAELGKNCHLMKCLLFHAFSLVVVNTVVIVLISTESLPQRGLPQGSVPFSCRWCTALFYVFPFVVVCVCIGRLTSTAV